MARWGEMRASGLIVLALVLGLLAGRGVEVSIDLLVLLGAISLGFIVMMIAEALEAFEEPRQTQSDTVIPQR
jgi:hypothetical protein